MGISFERINIKHTHTQHKYLLPINRSKGEREIEKETSGDKETVHFFEIIISRIFQLNIYWRKFLLSCGEKENKISKEKRNVCGKNERKKRKKEVKIKK